MKKQTRIVLLLAAGLILLAGLIAPVALANEGIWGPELPKASFLYRMGPEVRISTPSTPIDAHRHKPALAYNWNRGQYLVVWHNQWPGNRDIYAQRVSQSGQLVGGWFAVSAGSGDRIHPAVATNGQDKYMVVWDHEYNATDHDIRGREYNADGTPDGGYFSIAGWTQDDTVPDLAANAENRDWLAVWQRALPGGSGYSIHGFRWGSAGSGAYSYLLDVANWAFVECKNPAVAAGAPGYPIVYEEVNPPAKQHIYGRMWWPTATYLPRMLKNH